MTEANYNQQFQALRELLIPHESIWNEEILHLSWRLGAFYPEIWLEPILKLTEQEAYLFDTGKQIPPKLPSELKLLFSALKENTQFPRYQAKAPPPRNQSNFVFIKEKKVHELERLLPLVHEHFPSAIAAGILDIGGGLGHLARALAFELGAHVTSVDASEEFQNLGRAKLKSLRRPRKAGEIQFVSHLLAPLVSPALRALFKSHYLSIGLHTCGNLALAQMNHYLEGKQPALINFGCCYNRLNPPDEINLSESAKEAPLPLGPYALSLASRGYAKLTLEDYQLKKRVKLFRYGLHFLLERDYGVTFPHPVGECHTRIYRGAFHVYAQQKISELGHSLQHTPEQLDAFIELPKVKGQIESMIAGDLVRWQFGRAIESYLLLDRALYLRDQGCQVELLELFDETISPRNIALISRRACRNTSAAPRDY